MIQLPSIFVVDDEQRKLDIASEAFRALIRSEEVLDVSLCEIKTTDPELYLQARERLTRITGKGIVILDLGFRRSKEKPWDEVVNSLRQLSARTGLRFNEFSSGREEALVLQTPDGESTLEGPPLDGISLIESILSNVHLNPCLVIVCSSRGKLGNLQLFLDTFNKIAEESGRKVAFVRDPDGRDFGSELSAKGIFRSLERLWTTRFPDFSLEPLIDSSIREWIAYFRSLGQAMNPPQGFCGHDHIQDNLEAYEGILEKGLGCDHHAGALCKPEGLKAIFMVNASVFSAEWPEGAFGEWPPADHSFGDSAKPICRNMLTSMLRAISGLDLDMPDYTAKLPVTPGLPFLLSLHAVFESLRREGMLDTSNALAISSGPSGTRLTIKLKQDPKKEFGLARTWAEKVESGKETLNRGICGHLWNLVRSRVQISSEAINDSNEKNLLKLFKGPDRPVIGLHFAPHYIHLYWN